MNENEEPCIELNLQWRSVVLQQKTIFNCMEPGVILKINDDSSDSDR